MLKRGKQNWIKGKLNRLKVLHFQTNLRGSDGCTGFQIVNSKFLMNEENTNLKHIIENIYLKEEKKKKVIFPIIYD